MSTRTSQMDETMTSHTVAKVQDALSQSLHKVDQAAAAVGEKLQSAAETLEGTLSKSGTLGRAGRTVADEIKTSATYLQDEGLTGRFKISKVSFADIPFKHS